MPQNIENGIAIIVLILWVLSLARSNADRELMEAENERQARRREFDRDWPLHDGRRFE